jgi:hypothetical protein
VGMAIVMVSPSIAEGGVRMAVAEHRFLEQFIRS